jgi:hypothetical protein
VADGVGPGFGRDLDQTLGDQGPRDGGAEQVEPLVERIGPEHREDEVAHEFLAQVLDVDLLDAQHLGLLARRLQFLPLAEIGGEGHDLAAILRLEPFQDDRGVETAGIGEDDFLGRGHGRIPVFALTARAIPGFQKRGKVTEKCDGLWVSIAAPRAAAGVREPAEAAQLTLLLFLAPFAGFVLLGSAR